MHYFDYIQKFNTGGNLIQKFQNAAGPMRTSNPGPHARRSSKGNLIFDPDSKTFYIERKPGSYVPISYSEAVKSPYYEPSLQQGVSRAVNSHELSKVAENPASAWWPKPILPTEYPMYQSNTSSVSIPLNPNYRDPIASKDYDTRPTSGSPINTNTGVARAQIADNSRAAAQAGGVPNQFNRRDFYNEQRGTNTQQAWDRQRELVRAKQNGFDLVNGFNVDGYWGDTSETEWKRYQAWQQQQNQGAPVATPGAQQLTPENTPNISGLTAQINPQQNNSNATPESNSLSTAPNNTSFSKFNWRDYRNARMNNRQQLHTNIDMYRTLKNPEEAKQAIKNERKDFRRAQNQLFNNRITSSEIGYNVQNQNTQDFDHYTTYID